MKRLLTFVFVVPMAVATLSAQEVITTEQLSETVSAYTSENYTSYVENQLEMNKAKYDLNVPSLECNNSLQVGGGLPGLWLMAMLDLLYVDVDIFPDPTQYVSISDQLADYRYYRTKERVVTSLTLDYSYRVKKWLSLGAKGAVGFRTRGIRHKVTNDLLYRESRVAASLLFNMRFDWLHRRNVMMYSSLGVGVTSIFDYNDGMVFPMFDATYVGLTAGRKFYYFLELGAGASGTVRTGVGCRF